MEERRAADTTWKAGIEDSITVLQQGQDAIKKEIQRNTELTETILAIIAATQKFWNFVVKASNACLWIAKKGTIIAIAVTALYHALDAIASHDIGATLSKWWNK